MLAGKSVKDDHRAHRHRAQPVNIRAVAGWSSFVLVQRGSGAIGLGSLLGKAFCTKATMTKGGAIRHQSAANRRTIGMVYPFQNGTEDLTQEKQETIPDAESHFMGRQSIAERKNFIAISAP
jgi:hypothetical protein